MGEEHAERESRGASGWKRRHGKLQWVWCLGGVGPEAVRAAGLTGER